MHVEVPLCSESIVKKANPLVIRTVAPGYYMYFGLANQLHKISSLLIDLEVISLDIGIDGLPLFKSSAIQLWPILAKVFPATNADILLIGAFVGKKKPHSVNVFLHDFAAELSQLFLDGIYIKGSLKQIRIRCFICDAPARSFLCQSTGHNGLNGCSRCLQVGKRINKRTAYSATRALKRTNEDFVERKYPNFHKKFPDDKIVLEDIGIQMISQFPLDPMHLIDLGITKKMLVCLIKGHTEAKKLNKYQIENLSEKLKNLTTCIPAEFARKPRGLEEICTLKELATVKSTVLSG